MVVRVSEHRRCRRRGADRGRKGGLGLMTGRERGRAGRSEEDAGHGDPWQRDGEEERAGLWKGGETSGGGVERAWAGRQLRRGWNWIYAVADSLSALAETASARRAQTFWRRRQVLEGGGRGTSVGERR